jgi:hypothetical protein
MAVRRRTVDLSGYPDLVVIYLGLRVNALTGIKTVLGLGPQIAKSASDRPEGLLVHEMFLFSLIPMHVGIRQYWRDFETLERWSRSEPHRRWWSDFLRDSRGTGFWHETYRMAGGIEAIYDDLARPSGLAAFAPLADAKGSLFSARRRLEASNASDLASTSELPPAVAEADL